MNYTFDATVLRFGEDNGNPLYMTAELLMLSTKTNLNDVHFLESFVDSVVDRKDFYLTIPLTAERAKLEDGQASNLTHAYNKDIRRFESDIIGAFVDFYKEVRENGIVDLIGIVRIYKRYPELCRQIWKLYQDGALRFSYEAAIEECTQKDGITYIGASDHNYLIGMCIVSNPAVEDAQARVLVAEQLKKEEEQKMAEELLEKDKEIAELQKKLNQLTEEITELSKSVMEKDKEISELQQYKATCQTLTEEKEARERAERADKLREEYLQILPIEKMNDPEVCKMIDELDENGLNRLVKDLALLSARVRPDVQTAQRINGKIGFSHAPQSLKEKYHLS